MSRVSTTGFMLKSVICFAALVALIVYFPLVGTIIGWLYLIGLIVATFFQCLGLWLLFSGRGDTDNVVFISYQLASITGDVSSVRMAVSTTLSMLNLLLLWPIELLIWKWRLMHSSIGATEMQGQFGHTLIYPMIALKYLVVLLITVLFFIFDAPLYTIVICGVSAILWLIAQSVSTTSLLTQLKCSLGSVYARLWLVAAAQIAVLVLFFAYLALNENPSHDKVDLIRATFIELLFSPKGFIEAIADTSITLVDLAKIGAGILVYITLISLLFRTSDFARSDDDWIKLAAGELFVRRPEKALQALSYVSNKGSQELRMRANALLMLGRFDEALEAIEVRNYVLGDIEDEHDRYTEAAFYLINNKCDKDLFRAFINYWLEKERPYDAMLAMALLSYTVYLNDDINNLIEQLPEGKFPLSRALLHFNSAVTKKLEPDMDLIEKILNEDYDNILDYTLRNIFVAALLIDETFTSEMPVSQWLDSAIDNVADLTKQQCLLLYDRIMGLLWAAEDEPPHSELRAKVLELKDALLGRLDSDDVQRIRAMERRLSHHLKRKVLSLIRK